MSRSIALATGIAMAISTGAAWAQDQKPAGGQSSGLEEVVVTAERREENLQKVPVTVTAVSEQQLAASGVTNVQQLSALVPSLSVVDPTGYNMAFIRGIGSSTLGGGTFSSTAIYIDGVYIARTTNAMFELDSVDSVQVLAGPQGALYGRNATAGAIVITSRKPKPGADLSGNVSVTAGTYDTRDISAALSGGTGPRSAIGFTAAMHDRDGFVKNLNNAGPSFSTEDMDNRNALSASATWVFEPNDSTSWMVRGAYSRSNDHSGGGYAAVGLNSPGPFPGFSDNRSVFFAAIFGGFCPNPAVPAACPFGLATTQRIAAEAASSAVFATGFGESYDSQRSGFANGKLFGTSKTGSSLFIENALVVINGTFELDKLTIKSLTGYTNSDYHGSVQVGLEKPGSVQSPTLGAILGLPGPFVFNALGGLGFSSINPSKMWSQGFQFLSNADARIRWIGGVDWSRENGRVVQTGDGFGASNVGTDDKFVVTSKAAYAQATIPFADLWSATIGGRYTDETYDLVDYTGQVPREVLDGKKFTYTARVERQADDWLAYAGVTSGFKTGTLNAATTGAGSAEPEEVKTVEVGIKRDFADRYRLNASVYWSQYDNVQLNVIDQFTGGNVLDNGPKAEVKGIDLQAVGKFTDRFQVSLGATLLDAEFTENNANLPNIKGNRLPGSSKVAVSLVGDYHLPLASGASINFTGTVVHNGGKFYDHLNLVGSGGATADAFDVVNVNIGWTSANGNWNASLWGNNVFDEEYYRTGIIAFGTFGRAAIPGTPAHFGATLKYQF